MDKVRLSDYCLAIKDQLSLQEMLLQHIAKVEALVEILLVKDLIDCPRIKLHDYLLVISDLVDSARSINENSIGSLFKLYSGFHTKSFLSG